MVFQNYALYPHMSVYDNMAFGLRLQQLGGFVWRMTHTAEARRVREDIDTRIREAAELLDIKHLLDRKPKALSGGQRQRVALGRAIVRHPQSVLDGRAAFQPGCQAARANARRNHQAAPPPQSDHGLCDARPSRSHDDGAAHRRDARWQFCSSATRR
jgi:ABC-type arginine transport system ATPase subunit